MFIEYCYLCNRKLSVFLFFPRKKNTPDWIGQLEYHSRKASIPDGRIQFILTQDNYAIQQMLLMKLKHKMRWD